MSDGPLLSVTGLSKGYTWGKGRLEVLRGLDLTVTEGDLVAVLGASGVGKSTLLHLLGALDRPDAGACAFRGRELFVATDATLAAFRNKEVGFIFQFHHLLPEFTAEENVLMPGLIGGLSPDEALRRARALLTDLGLADRLDHRPGELSGGEQQRVAIARALVMEPSLLLADEPTGNLDPETGEQVFSLFRQMAKERKLTVVMATHNHDLARRMDAVHLMEAGRLMPKHLA
jgi:lipoprotein-releasing system ATP-binding protein